MTADTTRIVAVACATAAGGRIGGVVAESITAANRTIIGIANALAQEW